jgi:hypothetical protein
MPQMMIKTFAMRLRRRSTSMVHLLKRRNEPTMVAMIKMYSINRLGTLQLDITSHTVDLRFLIQSGLIPFSATLIVVEEHPRFRGCPTPDHDTDRVREPEPVTDATVTEGHLKTSAKAPRLMS